MRYQYLATAGTGYKINQFYAMMLLLPPYLYNALLIFILLFRVCEEAARGVFDSSTLVWRSTSRLPGSLLDLLSEGSVPLSSC